MSELELARFCWRAMVGSIGETLKFQHRDEPTLLERLKLVFVRHWRLKIFSFLGAVLLVFLKYNGSIGTP